ncbi:MAG: NYN domain-containing protein [Planctomycetaceae bacterium]
MTHLPPYLIIDGYNLMHAAGMTRKRYGPGDLERCRLRLQHELIRLLSADVIQRAVLVYDAFDSPSDDSCHLNFEGLEIRFSPRGTDADSEIERLLQQHSVPRRVLIVSGDHRLHRAAGRRRARCVDSEEFWSAITTGHDSTSPNSLPSRPQPERSSQTEPSPVTQEYTHHNDDEIFDADYLDQLQKDLNSNPRNLKPRNPKP